MEFRSLRTLPYLAGQLIWFHRDLPDEVPVPFDIDVLYRDERIVVVDKPHFLATIPRGQHIVHTALVRLRTELDLPEIGAGPPAGSVDGRGVDVHHRTAMARPLPESVS